MTELEKQLKVLENGRRSFRAIAAFTAFLIVLGVGLVFSPRHGDAAGKMVVQMIIPCFISYYMYVTLRALVSRKR